MLPLLGSASQALAPCFTQRGKEWQQRRWRLTIVINTKFVLLLQFSGSAIVLVTLSLVSRGYRNMDVEEQASQEDPPVEWS